MDNPTTPQGSSSLLSRSLWSGRGLVLAGIVHGRKLAGWAAAVVLHGSFNLVAVGMLQAGVHVLAVEALLIALAAALWLGILNSKRWFEPDRDSEVAPAPGIA